MESSGRLLVPLLALFSLLLIPSRYPAVAQTTFSLAPNQLILLPGGSGKVVAKGPNLASVQIVQVTNPATGQVVQGFSLSLDRSGLPATLGLQITAGAKTQAGGPYRLTLLNANSVVIGTSPLQIFSVTVASRPTGMPYVSAWTRSPGHIGSEIKFIGADFNVAYFSARIGTTPLALTYRATNEIRARLPAQRVTGDLIVGYGSWGFEYVLERGYTVKGDPVITSVTPASPYKGDRVTLTGIDLDMAVPLHRDYLGTAFDLVKLSNDSSSPLGSDFLRVGVADDRFTVNADGTQATFSVLEAYSVSLDRIQEISPPPQLSGKLRLERMGVTGNLSVATPSPVTYMGPTNMVLSSVSSNLWGEGALFAIVGGYNREAIVQFVGKGLYDGTQAAMGSVQLPTAGFNPEGDIGWAYVPTTAQSNPVVLTRTDGQRVTGPVVTVIPVPKFTPDTELFLNQSGPIRFALDTTYVLQGWYLKPTSVSGLNYEFVLSGVSTNPEQRPWLRYTLLSHTNSAIEFRVDLVGSLPSSYPQMTLFGGTSGSYFPLELKAKFGTKESVLFQRPYILTIGP